MNNMENWDKVSRPPITALKSIGGGRLKGMTDISPQWRYQVMTEVYGPCGIGWKFTVDQKWSEEGATITKDASYTGPDYKETAVFADITLYVKFDGQWSEGIPGSGGSMLIEKEKYGPHSSDEAYKMAVTDALSVAMKMIGVGAEIYLGNFDGTKYKTVKPEAKTEPATEPSKAQMELLFELGDACKGDEGEMKLLLAEMSHYEKDGKTGILKLDHLKKVNDNANFQRWVGSSIGKLRAWVKEQATGDPKTDTRPSVYDHIKTALTGLYGDDKKASLDAVQESQGTRDYRTLDAEKAKVFLFILESRLKKVKEAKDAIS